MLPFDLAAAIQLVGYPGIFLIIFAESGTIFAFFLPGASLLFTTGFLASQGVFNIWIIIPLLSIAAILGDNFGYWFGKTVGTKLFTRPDSRLFKQRYLERTRAFYAAYGSRTILFARFVPIVRTFAPVLAGVAGMPYRTFLFYNVLGGTLWATGVSLAGYTLGEVLPKSEEYITLIVLAVIAITCIPLAREWWRARRPVLAHPTAAIFDLDDTLAESFQQISRKTGAQLAALLRRMPVAIMTSADFAQVERRVLPNLPQDAPLERLYLFSDSSASCHRYHDASWQEEYNLGFSPEESERIRRALEETLQETGALEGAPQWGERILVRGASVALAALGLGAPLEEKRSWDPDGAKRRALAERLAEELPECEVRIGGATTIDITRKGITKAHGVRWLAKHLSCRPSEMLFVGDALYPGGNDEAVIETGIRTAAVRGPTETAAILEALARA